MPVEEQKCGIGNLEVIPFSQHRVAVAPEYFDSVAEQFVAIASAATRLVLAKVCVRRVQTRHVAVWGLLFRTLILGVLIGANVGQYLDSSQDCKRLSW